MKQQGESSPLLRVLKYTGLFGGVQGFNILISILRGKLTALLLSMRGMGLISAYSQAVELVGAATGMGIAFSAIQRISLLYGRGEEKTLQHYILLVRSWVIIVGLVGMSVVMLGARWWSIFYTNDPSSTWHYVGAAPLVLISAMIGGEMAILKGMRRIKSLATTSMLSAVSTLMVTAFFYSLWGSSSIVAALVLSSAMSLYFQWRATHRIAPYRLRLNSWHFLRRGRSMLLLGVAYAAANVVDMAAQSCVRAFIVHHPEHSGLSQLSGLELVGIFSVGITLTVTYSRLIFTSIDAEYYPRLSGLVHDVIQQNEAVNRQIDVLVLLISPFVLAFCLALPWIVRLLYSSSFLPATFVVMGAAFHLLFKAVATPIAFLALAHAKSRLYMVVEMLSSLFFVLCVSGGYYYSGLQGAGWGLTVSHAIYLLLVACIYSHHFDYRMDSSTLRSLLFQASLVAIGLAFLSFESVALHWGGTLSVLLLSVLYSWRTIVHSLSLHQIFKRK